MHGQQHIKIDSESTIIYSEIKKNQNKDRSFARRYAVSTGK